MSELLCSTKEWCVPGVRVVRINSNDKPATKRLVQDRQGSDYRGENLIVASDDDFNSFGYELMPATVLRGLASEESIRELQKARDRANAEIQHVHPDQAPSLTLGDIEFFITQHTIYKVTPNNIGDTDEDITHLPMHYSEGITINDIPVRLRVVSDLHNLVAASGVTIDTPFENRIRVAEKILKDYRKTNPLWGVSIVAMPQRKHADLSLDFCDQNSVTHTLMLRACEGPYYHEIELDGMIMGLYYIEHKKNSGQNPREFIMNSEEAQIVTGEMLRATNTNFKREIALLSDEQKGIALEQIPYALRKVADPTYTIATYL